MGGGEVKCAVAALSGDRLDGFEKRECALFHLRAIAVGGMSLLGYVEDAALETEPRGVAVLEEYGVSFIIVAQCLTRRPLRL